MAEYSNEGLNPADAIEYAALKMVFDNVYAGKDFISRGGIASLQ